MFAPCLVIFVKNFEHHCCCDFFQQIPCVHDELVMEVMWGIQHLIRELVPEEKSELSKEDRLPMSQGLKLFLSRCGYDIEPDMVSSVVGVTMLSGLPFSVTLYNSLFVVHFESFIVMDQSLGFKFPIEKTCLCNFLLVIKHCSLYPGQ